MSLELRVRQHIELRQPGVKSTHRPSKQSFYVTCYTQIPSRSLFLAGLGDGRITGWKSRAGEQVANANRQPSVMCTQHKGLVSCLFYDTLSQLLFSGSADYSICIWDPLVREVDKPCTQTLTGHGGTITGLAALEDHLFSSSRDGSIRVWRSQEGRQLLRYPFFTCVQVIREFGREWITCMFFSTNPQLGEAGELYAGDSAGMVSIYKPKIYGREVSLQTVRKLNKLHKLGVTSIVCSPKDNFLFTISHDCTVAVTNTRTGRPFTAIENPNGCRFTGVDWLPDNKELILSDLSGRVYIYSIYVEKCLKQQVLPYGPLSGIAKVMGSGQDFVVTSMEGIELMQIARNDYFSDYRGHTGAILGLAMSRRVRSSSNQGSASASAVVAAGTSNEDVSLLSSSVDNTIRRWQPYDMSCSQVIESPDAELSCSLHLPALDAFCAGHEDGLISSWAFESETLTQLQAHTNSVTGMAVGCTENRQYLLTVSFDAALKVWDLLAVLSGNTTSALIASIPDAHDKEILCVESADHADRAFTGSNDGAIKVWNLRSWKEIDELDGHSDAVTCLAMDGNFLFSGSEDCTVCVWDAISCVLLRTIAVHTHVVRDVLVLPDSGHVVSCSYDGTVRCTDYMANESRIVFKHADEFRCLAYWRRRRTVFVGTNSSSILSFALARPDDAGDGPNDDRASTASSEDSSPFDYWDEDAAAADDDNDDDDDDAMEIEHSSMLPALVTSAVKEATAATGAPVLSRVVGPYMGLKLCNMTEALVSSLKEQGKTRVQINGGAFVHEVITDSEAHHAGIRSGDVIIEVSGQPIARVEDTLSKFADGKGADAIAIDLKVRRFQGGGRTSIKLTRLKFRNLGGV